MTVISSLRNFLILSAAAVSTAAPPKAHQLDASYTFERYLAHFDKSYDDAAEYDRRSAVFAANMRKILRHNAGKMNEAGDVIGGGYVMGVNAFTDVPRDELPMGYNRALHPAYRSRLARGSGAVTSTERLLGATNTVTASYAKPPDFEMSEVAELPESVDWAKEGKVNPIIPHQGGCGSCWTFAATATIESHLAIATGEDPLSLSEENMLECAPNPDQCGGQGECSGSTAELGFNYIADITAKKTGGMYNIDDVPYSADEDNRCARLTEGITPSVGIDGWTQLPSNSYKAAMNAVAKVGPVAIAVAADHWSHYEKGVFDDCDAKTNHAVLLVGYGVDEDTGEKFYKVRNSWGPDFGEEGYIRIKRTDDDDHVCDVDSDPLVGLACALDDEGNAIDVEPVEVCGTCGILFDVAYPAGVHHVE